LRRERGERVVGDLRVGPGQGPEQRALASVGLAEQTDIRQELEFKTKVECLALEARVGVGGRLIRRGLVVFVAEAALAAAGDDEGLARLEVDLEFAGVGVVNQRPGGQTDNAVTPVGAVALLLHAVFAILGLPVGPAAEVQKRIDPVIGLEDHVATLAAVAALRAALGLVLLSTERDGASATMTCLHANNCLIDEHDRA
jgi:hypothetical protein